MTGFQDKTKNRIVLWLGMISLLPFNVFGQEPGLSVRSDARFSGDYGLRVSLEGENPYFLNNLSLQNEGRLRMRVYLRIGKLQLQEGSEMVFFSGKNQGEETVISLLVKKTASDYILVWRTLLDSGAILEGTETPVLSSKWQCVEMEWRAGDGNGLVQTWLDSVESSLVQGLANGTERVGSVQLGCIVQPPPGATGWVDLDDYELRQSGEIGMICYEREEWLGALNNWPQGQTICSLMVRMENQCQ